jgi:hypothetical protein
MVTLLLLLEVDPVEVKSGGCATTNGGADIATLRMTVGVGIDWDRGPRAR